MAWRTWLAVLSSVVRLACCVAMRAFCAVTSSLRVVSWVESDARARVMAPVGLELPRLSRVVGERLAEAAGVLQEADDVGVVGVEGGVEGGGVEGEGAGVGDGDAELVEVADAAAGGAGGEGERERALELGDDGVAVEGLGRAGGGVALLGGEVAEDGVVGGDEGLEGGLDVGVVVGDLGLDRSGGLGEELEGDSGDGGGDGVGAVVDGDAIDGEEGVLGGEAGVDIEGAGGGGDVREGGVGGGLGWWW